MVLLAPQIAVRGSGPPVFFATGLNNCMPSTGYSQIISLLSRHLTVITMDGQLFLDEPQLKHALLSTLSPGARASYVGHSSLLPSLLQCELVDKFVFLDPATVPQAYDFSNRRFIPRKLSVSPRKALTLNAEYTSRSARPFIPPGFRPGVNGSEIAELSRVGHADLLDDMYASACHRMGIRGNAPLRRAREVRAAYREELANMITSFVLGHHRSDISDDL